MTPGSSSGAPGVGGYVLAGGRSSRMGRDKSLLELAGHPLIAHAVGKLRRLATEAHILAGEAPGNPALAGFAPLVFDLHPGCGPAAGIEAALAHSAHDWNLILPVDLPFVPAAFLASWCAMVTRRGAAAPVAFFRVDGVPQPTLLLVRREVRPFLQAALARGDYKLLPILQQAARELAPENAPAHQAVPYELPIDRNLVLPGWQVPPANAPAWQVLTEAQKKAQPIWFANLNTPQEFAAAERHAGSLDRLA